jgi:hypothetical protein
VTVCSLLLVLTIVNSDYRICAFRMMLTVNRDYFLENH